VAKKTKVFFESLVEIIDDYLGDDDNPATEKPEKEKKHASKKVKKAEKKKLVKDADAPKKPLTPFMLYCAHRRAQMKAQGEGIFPTFNF